MTSSMQTKLRKLSADEIKQDYRVTRSDEVGSKGLYTLTKPEWLKLARPRSLQVGGVPSPFTGLKTPRSALSSATRGLFGFLTPSVMSPALDASTRDSYFG